jgi:hypothetical protein
VQFLDDATASVVYAMSTTGKRPEAGQTQHDFILGSLGDTFDAINAKEAANVERQRRILEENPSLDYFHPLRKTDPTTRQNLFDLGVAYAKVGQKEIAQAIADRSHDFVKTQIESEIALSDLKSGDTRLAEKFLEGVVTEDAARLLIVPDFLPQYAAALVKQGRQEEAMQLWSKVEASETMQKPLFLSPDTSFGPSMAEIERALMLYMGATTFEKAGVDPWDNDGKIRQLVYGARDILWKYEDMFATRVLPPSFFPQFSGATLGVLTSDIEDRLIGMKSLFQKRNINPVRFVQYAPVIEALQK